MKIPVQDYSGHKENNRYQVCYYKPLYLLPERLSVIECQNEQDGSYDPSSDGCGDNKQKYCKYHLGGLLQLFALKHREHKESQQQVKNDILPVIIFLMEKDIKGNDGHGGECGHSIDIALKVGGLSEAFRYKKAHDWNGKPSAYMEKLPQRRVKVNKSPSGMVDHHRNDSYYLKLCTV